MILALVLFLVTYILLLFLPKYRAYIALTSAALFIVLKIIELDKAYYALDWNVILMIAGTMGIVSLFIDSKMPSLLADIILEKTPNVKWAIVALSLFSGLISAFIDNVATVLMLAPVALNIAKKLKISPVMSIIAISVASNLQGAATLVGDTTSILLGGHAGLDFLDFFFFQGKIGIFWVVQAGALASTLVLLYFFRKETQIIDKAPRTKVTDYVPTVLLLAMVLLLILASFVPNRPHETNGIICMSLFVIGMIIKWIQTKKFTVVGKALKDIDFFTLLLLASLFVIIGGITEAGVVAAIGKLIEDISGGNLFVVYTIIVWASVVFSAFIDNIPYVMTMLPVVQSIAFTFDVPPFLLYFGLLSGATLGGNLTPIGASANITSIGILRKEGYEVTIGQFMKIGVPFTLAAVTVGYLVIWLIWA
jgi:Na+/H+ antiporter NhaD/arsenite permease-like protein